MRICLYILFFSISGFVLRGQAVDGSIQTYVEVHIDNVPLHDGDEYTILQSSDSLQWHLIHSFIMDHSWNQADSVSKLIDYELIHFHDTLFNRDYRVLSRTSNGPHWGLYIYSENPCREELIFMAPHTRSDLRTGLQAAHCYLATDGFALMLAGTHRCNSLKNSTCTGQTTACSSSSAPYRSSDLAHNTNSAWQLTTKILADSLANTYFFQLHGFSKQASDPYLIMSNGSRVTPVFDPISEIARYIKVIDTTLTSKIGHVDLSWNRLLGFWNTNGREINESPDACSSSATTSDGRFLHIEQEYQLLRKNINGWDKMARAIIATFPGEGCEYYKPINDNNIWFVAQDSVGDGLSWNNAHGNLADVLSLSDSGDTIVISQGSYYPTLSIDREKSFSLYKGVKIYGAFPEGGGAFAQRDPLLYPVYLSGNIGNSASALDDSHQVFTIQSLDQDAILDGVSLSKGADPDAASILMKDMQVIFKLKLVDVIVE